MSRVARTIVVSFLIGALSISAAWAGAALAPARLSGRANAESVSQAAVAALGKFGPDQRVLAGGSKVSIAPQPGEGDVWKTEGCYTITGGPYEQTVTHMPDLRSPWPEDPNCLYMGGYGIGPSNPIKGVDPEYGLYVRSVAVGDGTDTVVLTIIDGTSYFGDYNKFCDDCGAFELARELGTELGIDPSGFFIASTHSHTAPDFIGGWGGVPQWYMDQVADAVRTSVRQAVGGMRPAVLEAGDELGRQFGGERRDFYRSAEDATLTWFRALEVNPGGELTGKTLVTVGSFAAHPVTADEGPGIADADYPGVFAARVEKRFGGTGAFFMSGLGNISPRGDKLTMGNGLANLIPPVGQGMLVSGNDVKSAQAFWDQPVTNSGLTALGTPGFFDRPFAQTPASIEAGKNASRPCRSASPISVNTAVSAAKVGNLWLTGAPGETFSNLSATLKERNPGGVVLPMAQVNDGLGYIMQSFETDHAGRQAVGFVGSADLQVHEQGLAEYEDAYSMDACFGDKALETTISLLGGLE